MDYSKAQMVSVDGSLETLPLVFVTVTKRTKNLATTETHGNIRVLSLYLELFQWNHAHIGVCGPSWRFGF